MNKLMTVVAASVCAVSLSGSAFAAEDSSVGKQEAEGLEEKTDEIFEAGFDFDFFSAYVWRNAVQTDEMVMQPCVWADLTYFDPFWVGFSVWQNYDLTDRRGDVFRYGLNETDFNLHVGATAWESDDEELSLDVEFGHEWYSYDGVRDWCGESFLLNEYPDTRELYLRLEFANPVVDVYGQASWMYGEFGDYRSAMHYEIGFVKEVDLVEDVLTAGVDWNVNFGNHRYLAFLYGTQASGLYDHSDDPDEPDVYDDYDGAPDAGIGGTTVRLYLTWKVTEWCSLGATLAYTGVLNGSLRDSMGEQGGDYEFGYNPDTGYPRDLLWGGLSLKLSF